MKKQLYRCYALSKHWELKQRLADDSSVASLAFNAFRSACRRPFTVPWLPKCCGSRFWSLRKSESGGSDRREGSPGGSDRPEVKGSTIRDIAKCSAPRLLPGSPTLACTDQNSCALNGINEPQQRHCSRAIFDGITTFSIGSLGSFCRGQHRCK